MRHLIFALTLVVVSGGCGKSAQKLTAIQLEQLKEFSRNTSQVYSSAEAQGIEIPDTNRRGTRAQTSAFSLVNPRLTPSEVSAKMKNILQKGVRDGICKLRVGTTAAGTDLEFGNSSGNAIDLIGNNTCPAYFKIRFARGVTNASAAGSSVESTISLLYQAQTDAFKELADVTKMDFSGKIRVETVLEVSNAITKSNLEGNGTITSKKMGPVGIEMKSKAEATQDLAHIDHEPTVFGTVETKLNFKDFLVDLVADRTAAGKVTYSLNGESMTEAQIDDYFSGIAPKSTASSRQH